MSTGYITPGVFVCLFVLLCFLIIERWKQFQVIFLCCWKLEWYLLQLKSFENTGGIHTNFFRLTLEAAFELQVQVKVQLRKSILERERQPALNQLAGALLRWQPSIQHACCWTDPTCIVCLCDLMGSQSPYSLRFYSKRSYQLTKCDCGTTWLLLLTRGQETLWNGQNKGTSCPNRLSYIYCLLTWTFLCQI